MVFFLIAFFSMTSWAYPAFHGLALYGPADLKYKAGQAYEYANPKAPKGGQLTLSTLGSFTKLNPFTLKGIPAPGLGLVFETLMDGSNDADEAFSQYGLITEKVELAANRMSIIYFLNAKAKFSDGHSLTADDVVFSFNLIQDPEYSPFYKTYFADVSRAEKLDTHTVRFHFHKYNQELPLILGQLSILPKHIYGVAGKMFGKAFDDLVPVGSGPYILQSYDKGKYVIYQRNPKYWGQNIAVNKGRYNFDTLTYRIFLDPLTEREALKGGLVDASEINVAKDWALEFNGDYIQKGTIQKKTFKHQRVAGMQGFVFNLRKPIFQDILVRKAISAMLDFDSLNQNIFYNQYRRLVCYFDNNSELMSRGPARGSVLKVLKDLQKRYNQSDNIFVSEEAIFKGPYNIGDSPKKIALPQRLAQTNKLLDRLGWKYDPKVGARVKDGQVLKFEILIASPVWVRIVNPFIENLAQVGIKASYRLVQPAEYAQRTDSFDYDMVVGNFGQSLSPGNEQRDYWSSKAADTKGSRNIIGLKNPAVDEVIDRLINARSRRELVTYVQALDRILCAGFYVVPHWYIDVDRAIYWNKFAGPKKYASKAGFTGNLVNWWWAN